MASKNLHFLYATARLILLAFALSLAMAVEFAGGNGFLLALLAGALPWQSLTLICAMVIISTGAIINAFTAMMRPARIRVAGTLAAVALAMTAGLNANHTVAKLPVLLYFAASLAGHGLYAYCMMSLIVGCLKLSGKWAKYPPFIAGGAIVAFGAMGFVAQSWMSLEAVAIAFALVRDIALFLMPIVLLAALALLPSLRLDPHSASNSLRLRLPLDGSTPEQRLLMQTLALTLTGLTISCLANATLYAYGLTASSHSVWPALSTISLGCLGSLYLCLSEFAVFTRDHRHGNVTAKLAPISAQRFLKRHLIDKQSWAATAGLKTTNFTIDHDPGSALHAQLPASIMQIRSEEIQRCVNEVLGDMHLHSYAVGNLIFGAIDPETAVRPCIDTLKMFACLYLDAGPLVERRIKGLASLLPIVDPGLAHVLKSKDIGTLIRRNVWFFHFDFEWIDQHVIHTPRDTRYDIRIAALSSRMRQSMLVHLEKTGGVGNFVWIGPDARERLLQEAPAMRNVVEPCPIPAEGSKAGSEDELLMFIIKFEQLIPRLQRYFDLDTMRRALFDFEPSPESARLQNLLRLQITKAKTPGEIREVLGAITSVPWRGFREKDNALQLVLAAYNQVGALVGDSNKSLAATDDPEARSLYEKLLAAVKAVGYPSQVLHNAQISKIALRDVQTLKDVASDPNHPRFAEAWLLMATNDYSRYKPEQRHELLTFLRDVRQLPKVAAQRLVQIKAVDSLASLGRAEEDGDLALLADVAAEVCRWFTEFRVDPDICCLLLDAHFFLAQHLSRPFELPAATQTALDTYFQAVTSELGGSHPKVIALMSRWQEFRARKPATVAAA